MLVEDRILTMYPTKRIRAPFGTLQLLLTLWIACVADPLPGQEEEPMHTNRLVNETSPYLLQHAHNPVDWYPWGDEAFEKAKRENKPIFLSIGYSTCYWCHVMEVQCFEDLDVAKVLNEHFIAIKVDREERPDIDEQYMLATQFLTNRGGWPNSVWLTPDGRPWMAGTYFPKDSFVKLLTQLHDLWTQQHEKVEKVATSLSEEIRKVGKPSGLPEGELSLDLVDQATKSFLSQFDSERGGFGGAPKFPPHGTLRLLIHQYKASPDPRVLESITKTLDAMWLGGFRDHVGGGFHRYSTDAKWLLPHFEKMLYDNAQLMRIYAETFAITNNPRYRLAVGDIYRWIRREMISPDGGFYSALDSGEVDKEGEAYVWAISQINETLSESDATLFADVYQITEEGNFAEESTGQRIGKNIPYLAKPLEETAKERGLDPVEFQTRLSQIRDQLLQERLTWPQPHRDDKVLTSWNGLMIESLAIAGRQLNEPEYIETASKAAEFILQEMRSDRVVFRSHRNGQSKLPGYLDDYVYLTKGLLELYKATGNQELLEHVVQLADRIRSEFEDSENGGFFQSGESHETLLVRSKFLGAGGNLPNTNGVAAQILLELAELTDEPEYRKSAENTLRAFVFSMSRQAHTNEELLIATADWFAATTDQETDATDSNRNKTRLKPLNVTTKLSQQTVVPGDRTELTLTLEIDSGFHLYAVNPNVDFVKPTAVKIEGGPEIVLEKIQSPNPKALADPVWNQSINVYSGVVQFKATLMIRPEAKEETKELKVTLRFQACDDKQCMQPQELTLKVPITITQSQER